MSLEDPMRGADWSDLLLKQFPELADLKDLPELVDQKDLGKADSTNLNCTCIECSARSDDDIIELGEDYSIVKEILLGVGFAIVSIVFISIVLLLGIMLIASINSVAVWVQ